jgi:hypothetical protein
MPVNAFRRRSRKLKLHEFQISSGTEPTKELLLKSKEDKEFILTKKLGIEPLKRLLLRERWFRSDNHAIAEDKVPNNWFPPRSKDHRYESEVSPQKSSSDSIRPTE